MRGDCIDLFRKYHDQIKVSDRHESAETGETTVYFDAPLALIKEVDGLKGFSFVGDLDETIGTDISLSFPTGDGDTMFSYDWVDVDPGYEEIAVLFEIMERSRKEK